MYCTSYVVCQKRFRYKTFVSVVLILPHFLLSKNTLGIVQTICGFLVDFFLCLKRQMRFSLVQIFVRYHDCGPTLLKFTILQVK